MPARYKLLLVLNLIAAVAVLIEMTYMLTH
jgi:hypothetical protein